MIVLHVNRRNRQGSVSMARTRLQRLLLLGTFLPALAFMNGGARPLRMTVQHKENKPSFGATPNLSKVAFWIPVILGGFYGSTFNPAPVLADGAVSAATTARAGALYGPRVIALQGAAEKGDFAAFVQQDGACRLFNSGAFAMNRPLQKEVQKAYAEVQAAVAAKDAAKLKSAYATYFKTAHLDQTNPFSMKDKGQAFSSDFMYTLKNAQFDSITPGLE